MTKLTASDLLQIWSMSFQQHPVDRALTFLSVIMPDSTLKNLAELSLGERNSLLLRLRELVFGTKMECLTRCIDCKESLQFTINTYQLYTRDVASEASKQQQIAIEEYLFTFRLLNSYDLAAIVISNPLEMISNRQLLLLRSIITIENQHTKQNLQIEDLEEEVIEKYIAKLESLDPCAELLLAMECPACGKKWQALLDIVTFLWEEIKTRAKQIMWEIHKLASSYCWNEAEILALDECRKQYYISQLND